MKHLYKQNRIYRILFNFLLTIGGATIIGACEPYFNIEAPAFDIKGKWAHISDGDQVDHTIYFDQGTMITREFVQSGFYDDNRIWFREQEVEYAENNLKYSLNGTELKVRINNTDGQEGPGMGNVNSFQLLGQISMQGDTLLINTDKYVMYQKIEFGYSCYIEAENVHPEYPYLSAPAEGCILTIPIRISRPIPNGKFKVSTRENWIQINSIKEREVQLLIQPSHTMSSRRGHVTISYTAAENEINIEIIQSK